jgi:hypothetical protein
MMIADDSDLDMPADDTQAMWRERERRQRSVRFLMMFLLMLLLMDGEEQSQRRRSHEGSTRLRGKIPPATKDQALDPLTFHQRREQDEVLERTMRNHPKYQHLIARNDGKDIDAEVRAWAEQQLDLQKDEFALDVGENVDPEEETKIFHYPWNASGFYRGEWTRDDTELDTNHRMDNNAQRPVSHSRTEAVKKQSTEASVDVTELEAPMRDILKQRQERLGVFILPRGLHIKLPNSTVVPEQTDSTRSNRKQHPLLLRGAEKSQTMEEAETGALHVTLTKPSGRAAFQLYSRSVPATKEISILNGFVKLYDSNTVGYSTRRDILLRVNGVLFHSLGKISLVSNAGPGTGRSALVIDCEDDINERRRLLRQTLLSVDTESEIEQIRDETLDLFPFDYLSEHRLESDRIGEILSPDIILNRDNTPKEVHYVPLKQDEKTEFLHRRLAEDPNETKNGDAAPGSHEENHVESQSKKVHRPTYIFPYPYAIDDKDQSIERMRKTTPAARSMPPREQLLEANAGRCEFEISMNIQEEEWTLGQWRKLVSRHMNEASRLDPSRLQEEAASEKGQDKGGKENREVKKTGSSKTSKAVLDQALVMTMNGTIRSENCNFSSNVNATAIRTDWENTTGKAINYSFYMMLTCLTQIVLLLRQLLHTQTQSAATKVSLLCVGWQTVLDALLCLVHIYLSLAMQPLFTAFASVAFFKLLIFCVIEMKYMAIIIQARNANSGGNTIDLLRRQIAMLHLRFYVALIGCFLLFFYAWESYRTIYILSLYSFWMPQIIQNVVTEAKRPLHPYYIHGMSFTRLIAPIYIFAVQNNFLKEVYPDSPTNTFMCELLILWVGIQSAILEAQGRYGARFMIPTRFLPPKFDYSRPIPDSLLPSGGQDMTPSETLRSERGPPTEVRSLIPTDSSPLRATGRARNRIKGSKANRSECGMTTETLSTTPCNPPSPSFDCVICYSEIEVRNRRGYMLAPCDHLFHRECLEQWMEVKMECPICRHNLPSL